jgi:hypothetical protein
MYLLYVPAAAASDSILRGGDDLFEQISDISTYYFPVVDNMSDPIQILPIRSTTATQTSLPSDSFSRLLNLVSASSCHLFFWQLYFYVHKMITNIWQPNTPIPFRRVAVAATAWNFQSAATKRLLRPVMPHRKRKREASRAPPAQLTPFRQQVRSLDLTDFSHEGD